jgi:hypothetical protein
LSTFIIHLYQFSCIYILDADANQGIQKNL